MLLCVPSKLLLLTTQPHFGETCSQDKGHMPQLGLWVDLELTGAFHRHHLSLSLYHFLHSFILKHLNALSSLWLWDSVLPSASSAQNSTRNPTSPPSRSSIKGTLEEPSWQWVWDALFVPVPECITLKQSDFFIFVRQMKISSSFWGGRVFYLS